MSSIDDLPLDTGEHADTVVERPAASSHGPTAVVVVLLVGALAGAIWYFAVRGTGTAERTAAGPVPAAGAVPLDEPAAAAVTPELPPLSGMDDLIRQELTRLGTSPALLAWLASDDLVASIVTAVERLAAGDSPARDLGVLRPGQAFTTERHNGVTVASSASYARYGAIVTAVRAIDPDTLARLVTAWMPRLDEAYRALGHPEGGFDVVLRRAVQVVASTPDVPPDAALVPGVGGLAYANPDYERLPAAQKHLWRMGPDHLQVVRDAARRFGAALPPAASRP